MKIFRSNTFFKTDPINTFNIIRHLTSSPSTNILQFLRFHQTLTYIKSHAMTGIPGDNIGMFGNFELGQVH